MSKRHETPEGTRGPSDGADLVQGQVATSVDDSGGVVVYPPRLLDDPDELERVLKGEELPEPVAEETASAARMQAVLELLAPLPIDESKVDELLRQEGLTREEWAALTAEEQRDPDVQRALADLDRGVSQLAELVAIKGLRVTPTQYADRHREIAARWNDAVANTRTMMRYCPECGAPVVGRHRLSPFCSDACKKRRRSRERNMKRKLAGTR